jgi:putative endonuclease
MHDVYSLTNQSHPGQRYVGVTSDLKKRLNDHNKGFSIHTAKYMPWTLQTYIAFQNPRKAREFEYYLKSGSGKAFANKRLW